MVDEQKLRQLACNAIGWDWQLSPWRTESNGSADCGVFFEKNPGHAYSICRAPRYSKKVEWMATGGFIAAANPAAILSLLDELQTLREERTAWRVTAENAEAAVKQARIDALEEAKTACNDEADQFRECQKGASDGRYDWKEDGARDCASAIESLKGKTP